MTIPTATSDAAIDELLAGFQRACENVVLANERVVDRRREERSAAAAVLRETLLQLQRENAESSARWVVFRTAVEAVDAQMRVIASAVADMGEPELAALLRETALRMFMSVQDESTQATAGNSQPNR